MRRMLDPKEVGGGGGGIQNHIYTIGLTGKTIVSQSDPILCSFTLQSSKDATDLTIGETSDIINVYSKYKELFEKNGRYPISGISHEYGKVFIANSVKIDITSTPGKIKMTIYGIDLNTGEQLRWYSGPVENIIGTITKIQ